MFLGQDVPVRSARNALAIVCQEPLTLYASQYYYLLPKIAVAAPPGSRERKANYYDKLQNPQSLPKRSFSLNDIMGLKVMLRA